MTVDDQALSIRTSAEVREYVDELWRRLCVLSTWSRAIPAQERGSSEGLIAAGALWRQARERASVSLEDVATRLGISVNQVRFLEMGLVAPHELSERRLRDYARAVGDPSLYDQYRTRFHR